MCLSGVRCGGPNVQLVSEQPYILNRHPPEATDTGSKTPRSGASNASERDNTSGSAVLSLLEAVHGQICPVTLFRAFVYNQKMSAFIRVDLMSTDITVISRDMYLKCIRAVNTKCYGDVNVHMVLDIFTYMRISS